jgi:hypothetical protein
VADTVLVKHEKGETGLSGVCPLKQSVKKLCN